MKYNVLFALAEVLLETAKPLGALQFEWKVSRHPSHISQPARPLPNQPRPTFLFPETFAQQIEMDSHPDNPAPSCLASLTLLSIVGQGKTRILGHTVINLTEMLLSGPQQIVKQVTLGTLCKATYKLSIQSVLSNQQPLPFRPILSYLPDLPLPPQLQGADQLQSVRRVLAEYSEQRATYLEKRVNKLYNRLQNLQDHKGEILSRHGHCIQGEGQGCGSQLHKEFLILEKELQYESLSLTLYTQQRDSQLRIKQQFDGKQGLLPFNMNALAKLFRAKDQLNDRIIDRISETTALLAEARLWAQSADRVVRGRNSRVAQLQQGVEQLQNQIELKDKEIREWAQGRRLLQGELRTASQHLQVIGKEFVSREQQYVNLLTIATEKMETLTREYSSSLDQCALQLAMKGQQLLILDAERREQQGRRIALQQQILMREQRPVRHDKCIQASEVDPRVECFNRFYARVIPVFKEQTFQDKVLTIQRLIADLKQERAELKTQLLAAQEDSRKKLNIPAESGPRLETQDQDAQILRGQQQARQNILKTKNKQLLAQVQQLKTQVTELRRQESKLKAEMTQLKVIKSQVQDLRELRRVQSGLKAEVQDLRQLRRIQSGLKAQNLELRKAESSLRAQLSEQKRVENGLRVELAQLKRVESGLRNELLQQRKVDGGLKGELAQLRRAENSLKGEVAQLRKLENGLRNELAESRRMEGALKGDFAESRRVQSSLKNEVAQLRRIQSEQKTLLQQLRVQVAHLKQQLGQSKRAQGAARAELAETKKADAILKNEAAERRRTESTLRAEIADQKRVEAGLRADITALSRNQQALRKAIQELQASTWQRCSREEASRQEREQRLSGEVESLRRQLRVKELIVKSYERVI